MKLTALLVFLCFGAISAFGQAKIPDLGTAAWAKLPDDTVLVVFPEDGYKLTVGKLKIFASLVDPSSQAAIAGPQPYIFVEQFALMRKLTALALAEKVDQQSPTRDQIEYNRMVALSTAEVTNLINAPVVESPDIQAYYNTHKDEFKQIMVKDIKVVFGEKSGTAPGGKKILSEDEAKAKAVKLLTQAKAGADFGKLARENSDDEATKEHDGDFHDPIKPTDTIPDALRVALFKLKEGEVSDPVRQANGFYLLKADKIVYTPLAKVQDQIFSKLKEQKGMATMNKLREDLKIEYPNPAFPGRPPAKK